ncbi:hypothetical protein [Nocardioides pakistanensis]
MTGRPGRDAWFAALDGHEVRRVATLAKRRRIKALRDERREYRRRMSA